MVSALAGAAASVAGDALGGLLGSKAALVTETGLRIECQFNPTNYVLDRTVTIERTATTATPGGVGEYRGTSGTKLTTSLLFDDFASPFGDVTPKIDMLFSWTRPTEESISRKQPCPPKVGLEWGRNAQLAGFFGFITALKVQYTLFAFDGTPLQARIDITIDGQQEGPAGTNPTSRATDARRARIVGDGDTLQSIATAELGRPQFWRAIAELNGIDDPARVRPGTSLLIPSRADALRKG